MRIVGAKNSAVEHALNCYRAGARVTLISRGPAFKPTVKYWLRPDIENRIKAGEISARWDTRVVRIEADGVVCEQGGREERIRADLVYLLTGFHPDFDFFRSLGIRLDPDTDRPELDPATLETNVPGLFMAGSIVSGRRISEVFIENGRYDGEKIFGDRESRSRAERTYAEERREVGE